MLVSHKPGQVSAVFGDPNLVSCAGLAPVVALAERRAGRAGREPPDAAGGRVA